MEEIEYCKLIEAWSDYHEASIGCECDMFESRRCQNIGDGCCDCQCHMIYNNKKIIINADCKTCIFYLDQALVKLIPVSIIQSTRDVN